MKAQKESPIRLTIRVSNPVLGSSVGPDRVVRVVVYVCILMVHTSSQGDQYDAIFEMRIDGTAGN